MEKHVRPFRGKDNPIIVALDVSDWRAAQDLVDQLSSMVGFFKIGMELFTAEGPRVIQTVKETGGRVFLDLKYHDIPNTVKGAVAAAAGLGVDMLTVHASGGRAMLEPAVQSVASFPDPPILLGVTVLTSIDEETLISQLRVSSRVEEQVVHLGRMAIGSGLQGVVASPLEISSLRHALGKEAVIVTPGIRPAWYRQGDQKRVTTPQEAVSLGADYLVIGRPITAASNPREAASRILQDLQGDNEGVTDR